MSKQHEMPVNQPGPLTAGGECPSDAAWEAFFSACWDLYDEVLRRRTAKHKAGQSHADEAEVIPMALKQDQEGHRENG